MTFSTRSSRVALIAGALALSLSGAALAQKGQKGQKGKGQNRGAAVMPAAAMNRLNLNADQKAKVQAATAAFQAEQQKVKGLEGKERRQALKGARQTYESAVRA